MRILIAAAACAAAMPAAALAQTSTTGTAYDMGTTATPTDTATATTTTAPANAADDAATPRAPDGSRAFGIEPYVGVMGGYEQFDDSHPVAGIPRAPGGRDFDGGLVQGVAGINVPLGPVFVGVEGNAAKGVSGDIDWEYGVAGRLGFRIGESGLIYGKAGYQWVNFDALGKDSRDFHDITAGLGIEVGPRDIGLGGVTGKSGVRFRLELNSFGKSFNSFQPMAGVVFHF